MSVPIHNLYDFVHQTTKKQFLLLYFYTWGSRNINDIRHLIHSERMLNGPSGISCQDRMDLKFLNDGNLNQVIQFQPILLCYDQEPLNFDLYLDSTPDIQALASEHPVHKNLNLRWQNVYSHQKVWTLLHSELNSPELNKYENTGLFKGAYWWSHAIIARDWYRYAEYDTSLYTGNSWKKLFLSYCRETNGSREYRKEFLSQITTLDCQTQSFNNNAVGSDASAVYNTEDFNSTAISVVLETVFDQRIHLTEKILRPIALGHPFILAAGPGSLELLRSYGFHTFTGYINESYDKIHNPTERLAAITKEMHRIQNLSKSQLDELIKCIQNIARINRQRFFSKDFMNQLTNELYCNVNSAYEYHQGQIDLTAWWKNRCWLKHNRVEDYNKPIYKKNSRHLIPLYRQQRSKGVL